MPRIARQLHGIHPRVCWIRSPAPSDHGGRTQVCLDAALCARLRGLGVVVGRSSRRQSSRGDGVEAEVLQDSRRGLRVRNSSEDPASPAAVGAFQEGERSGYYPSRRILPLDCDLSHYSHRGIDGIRRLTHARFGLAHPIIRRGSSHRVHGPSGGRGPAERRHPAGLAPVGDGMRPGSARDRGVRPESASPPLTTPVAERTAALGGMERTPNRLDGEL
jgi:hypothetical protein